MSNDNTLPRLICDDMQLDRLPPKSGGNWKWESAPDEDEDAEKNELLLALDSEDDYASSVAFSLDMNSDQVRARFPFFQDGKNAISKIAQICDIIVLTKKGDALRAFVIEVKDNNTDNANTQIKNGAFFCEWLHRLLNEHCDIPPKLEIARILCMTRRGAKKAGVSPIKPKPLRDTQTLQYKSVKKIRLEDAYKDCKRHKILEARHIPAK